MKKIFSVVVFVVALTLTNQCFAQNLPVVTKSTNEFNLYMVDDDDTPLIYGYESASTSSKKMICFSTFTADVDGNPHKCVLGAYYTTDEIEIGYLGMEGDFAKLKFVSTGKSDVIFYIEKKFIKFK